MYKNVTTEWAETLPVGWKAVPLKRLLENGSMKVGPFGSQLSGNDFKDEGYWVYNQRVIVDENFSDNTAFIDASKYNSMRAFHVHAGDILVTTRGTIGRICQVPMNYHEGIIHPCVIKFRLSEKEIPFSILKHIFNESNIVKDQLLFLSNATTIDVIYSGTLKDIKIPVPPRNAQKKISAFLDSKCSEIDAISADIQKEAETLEQYKCSVITEAVTKGLNPDAEMKESGIEWVGNIPAHWDVHPLYYYFSERKKKNYLGQEQNLLSLSYGKVIRKDINTSEGLLPDSFNGYNIIEPGDIVLRLTDLQNDKRSLRTGLVMEHGIITSAYVTLKAAKEVVPEYFHYLLHAYDVMKVLYNMGNGVRQGLNYSELSKMHIVAPPIDEQKNIAAYLDSKCKEIESIIESKKQQLTVIDSYKKSLIYEYVTGKKEVPTYES